MTRPLHKLCNMELGRAAISEGDGVQSRGRRPSECDLNFGDLDNSYVSGNKNCAIENGLGTLGIWQKKERKKNNPSNRRPYIS